MPTGAEAEAGRAAQPGADDLAVAAEALRKVVTELVAAAAAAIVDIAQ